ncbi:hypothetical protein CCUS01_03514 [Colletotrichum cuscutae]|uniref:Uncharacterized protein n=1 Tax=Colletotrichum cuscutae TaxID=1209917 RepID=A0AAI9Y535_9PEZI|nr:hypothetical protein CCUS01_03514 [Colletotrichum cuscutae]
MAGTPTHRRAGRSLWGGIPEVTRMNISFTCMHTLSINRLTSAILCQNPRSQETLWDAFLTLTSLAVTLLHYYLPLLSPLWEALFPKLVDLEQESNFLRKFVQSLLETGDHSDFTKLNASTTLALGSKLQLSQPKHEERQGMIGLFTNCPISTLLFMRACVYLPQERCRFHVTRQNRTPLLMDISYPKIRSWHSTFPDGWQFKTTLIDNVYFLPLGLAHGLALGGSKLGYFINVELEVLGQGSLLKCSLLQVSY